MADVDLAILLEELGASNLEAAVSVIAKLRTDSQNLSKILAALEATSTTEALAKIESLKTVSESTSTATTSSETTSDERDNEANAVAPVNESVADDKVASTAADESVEREEQKDSATPSAENEGESDDKTESTPSVENAEPATQATNSDENAQLDENSPATSETIEQQDEAAVCESSSGVENKEPAKNEDEELNKAPETVSSSTTDSSNVTQEAQQVSSAEQSASNTDELKNREQEQPTQKDNVPESEQQKDTAPRAKGNVAARWNQVLQQTQASKPSSDRAQPSVSSNKIMERLQAFTQKPKVPEVTKPVPQPRERAGITTCDAPSVLKGYNQVRDDNDPVNLAIFEHDETGSKIRLVKTSDEGLQGLLREIRPDRRFYAYCRVITGDDLSRRPKFIFVLWVGDQVSLLKKARATTDKALVKEIVKEMVLEVFATSPEDLDEEKLMAAVKKAGGADYGTGHRA